MTDADGGEEDALAGVSARLEALEGRPLSEHADVLDEVHRALVDELERLDSPSARGGSAQEDDTAAG